MRGEELERDEGAVLRSFMPRVGPSTTFVRSLGEEIRRSAGQRVELEQGAPFEDMVIELRKLVRLLCRTLVPVQPRPAFARALGNQLREQAIKVTVEPEHRWRWLMVGGLVGSLLSVLGLVAALLLRRRNGRPNAQKWAGAS
jgi:hypothetical protein